MLKQNPAYARPFVSGRKPIPLTFYVFMNKRYRFFLFLIIVFLTVSCSDSKALFNSGNFKKTISYVDSLRNPSLLDIYYQMLSYNELGQTQNGLNSAKLFLLMYPDNDDTFKSTRAEVIDFLIENDVSDDVCILLFEPTDGLEASLCLYTAYIRKNNFTESKEIYRNYLAKELNDFDKLTLLMKYSYEDSEILQILQSIASDLNTENLPQFINRVTSIVNNHTEYKFSINDYQHFLSILTSVANLSITEREQKSVCYKNMGKIYLFIGDRTRSDECFSIAYNLNMYDEELSRYVR